MTTHIKLAANTIGFDFLSSVQSSSIARAYAKRKIPTVRHPAHEEVNDDWNKGMTAASAEHGVMSEIERSSRTNREFMFLNITWSIKWADDYMKLLAKHWTRYKTRCPEKSSPIIVCCCFIPPMNLT